MKLVRLLGPLFGTLTLALVSAPAFAQDEDAPKRGSWFGDADPGDGEVDIEVEIDPETGKARLSGKRRSADKSAPAKKGPRKAQLRQASDEEADDEEFEEEVDEDDGSWTEEEVEEVEEVEEAPPPKPTPKHKKKKKKKKATVIVVEREERTAKPKAKKKSTPPPVVVEEDRARFRGGVSALFGGTSDDGREFQFASGVEGRFGVQMNDTFAIYAAPSILGSERLRLGAGVVVEATLDDIFSLGGGVDGLMVSDSGEFGDWDPGIGAQGRVGLHFGRVKPSRRKVFSMHGNVRADVHTQGTSAFTLGLMLGYDSM